MKRRLFMTCFSLVCLLLLFWQSSLCPQEKPGESRPKPKPIEGVWTEISHEMEGEIVSLLVPIPPLPNMPITGHYIWKISKDTIERGSDRKDRFPLDRASYELNPGGLEGAIDAIPLDDKTKDKEKKGKRKKGLGIYCVRDDYLIICFGRGSRPKSFTSSEDNPNQVHVLRRGRLDDRNWIQGGSSAKSKDK